MNSENTLTNKKQEEMMTKLINAEKIRQLEEENLIIQNDIDEILLNIAEMVNDKAVRITELTKLRDQLKEYK